MASKNQICTIHVIVRTETFEISRTLYNQLVEYSSKSNVFPSLSEQEHSIYFDIDPNIFNAYLLYIQSGYFIRPEHLSQKELIDGLRQCSAPLNLIHHYESSDLFSVLSSQKYASYFTKQNLSNLLILTGLFISTCMLTIDLYRQILILNKNSYEEQRFQIFIILMYVVDSILFVYSCLDGIFNFISNRNERNKHIHCLVDMISCLGILCYFTIQQPMTHVYFLWIFTHLCRSFRLLQMGCRLIDIQYCIYALFSCVLTFIQTITGLFWILLLSGSILYTIDIIEQNQQYATMQSTVLSAYETLYTIGYRNNAPNGYATRIWAIISLYFLSPLIQLLLWWFQTRVTIEWKKKRTLQ